MTHLAEIVELGTRWLTPAATGGYTLLVFSLLKRQRDKEGERAFMFVALATHFGLGPEAEKLAYAYRVSPIWAETWLHAAKRSGFLQSEHVTLEDVLESGVASLYTEKGMTALRQLDELIERYRKLVSRVVTPDTPIFCAMMAQRPDQTEVGKEIWARLAARGGMPDDE